MTATEEDESRGAPSEASVNDARDVVHVDVDDGGDHRKDDGGLRSVLDALVRARLEENANGRKPGGLGRLPQHEFWETQPVG